jgi:hypothetical protein
MKAFKRLMLAGYVTAAAELMRSPNRQSANSSRKLRAGPSSGFLRDRAGD